MTILIHGTTVITADDADRVLYDAAIAIEAGRITAIGPSEALRARVPAAEAVDGRDRAVPTAARRRRSRRWATRNGYAAMGMPDGGWLAPGNKADLLMIRTDRLHLVPRLRMAATFVHQGQAADVDGMMVDGAWVMRDSRVLTMDEPRIIAEADRIARRAWTRLFAERTDLPVPPGFAPG